MPKAIKTANLERSFIEGDKVYTAIKADVDTEGKVIGYQYEIAPKRIGFFEALFDGIFNGGLLGLVLVAIFVILGVFLA